MSSKSTLVFRRNTRFGRSDNSDLVVGINVSWSRSQGRFGPNQNTSKSLNCPFRDRDCFLPVFSLQRNFLNFIIKIDLFQDKDLNFIMPYFWAYYFVGCVCGKVYAGFRYSFGDKYITVYNCSQLNYKDILHILCRVLGLFLNRV